MMARVQEPDLGPDSFEPPFNQPYIWLMETKRTAPDSDPVAKLDVVDLGEIATFLSALHPQHTRCELVRALAGIAPLQDCSCSLCSPTKFPCCQGEPGGGKTDAG